MADVRLKDVHELLEPNGLLLERGDVRDDVLRGRMLGLDELLGEIDDLRELGLLVIEREFHVEFVLNERARFELARLRPVAVELHVFHAVYIVELVVNQLHKLVQRVEILLIDAEILLQDREKEREREIEIQEIGREDEEMSRAVDDLRRCSYRE